MVQLAPRFPHMTLVGLGGGAYPLLHALFSLRSAFETAAFAAVRAVVLVSPLVSAEPLPSHAKSRLLACWQRAVCPNATAAPLHQSWAQLPPTLVQWAPAELAADDAGRACKLLGAACTPHVLEHAGAFAELVRWRALIPEAQQAFDRVADFIGQH